MKSLLNGPAHNNNNNSGNKFHIIRTLAYDSFHHIYMQSSITVILCVLLLFMWPLLSLSHIVQSFYSVVHTILNVPTHVISICLFLIFYSRTRTFYDFERTPNGRVNICGIWWAFFISFVLSFKFLGVYSPCINNKRQARVFTMPNIHCCYPTNPTNHCAVDNGITHTQSLFYSSANKQKTIKLVIFEWGISSFLCRKKFLESSMFRLR